MRDFEIVDANLRSAMRFFGGATGTGEIRTLDGALAVYSGLDYGVFNIAFLEGASPEGIEGFKERLAQCARYFAPRTMRWSFWLCEDVARRPHSPQGALPVDGSRSAPHLASSWNAGRSAGAAGAAAAQNRMLAGGGSRDAAGVRRPHRGELRYPHENRASRVRARARLVRRLSGICRNGGREAGGRCRHGHDGGRCGCVLAFDAPRISPAGLRRSAAARRGRRRTGAHRESGAWCSSRPMPDIRCTGGWGSTKSRSSRYI